MTVLGDVGAAVVVAIVVGAVGDGVLVALDVIGVAAVVAVVCRERREFVAPWE